MISFQPLGPSDPNLSHKDCLYDETNWSSGGSLVRRDNRFIDDVGSMGVGSNMASG